MTIIFTLICEVFCHHFYLAAIYLLGALVAFHGQNTLTLLNMMRSFRFPNRACAAYSSARFLRNHDRQAISMIFSKRPPSFQDSLSLQHPPWIPDSRCVFLKRLLQKRRLQISHPSPWATSVSTGAAQHGGCIPLWRISSSAGFIHDPGWKTRHHQTHLRGQVSFFRT